MPNFEFRLGTHTRKGLRVLAIAQKSLFYFDGSLAAVQQISRAEAESGLRFLGFLLFTNLLRKDSPAAIDALKSAGCCLYMATGDGLITSAAIGYQVGILNPKVKFIISGELNEERKLKWRIKKFDSSFKEQQKLTTEKREEDNKQLNDDDFDINKNESSNNKEKEKEENEEESESLLELIKGKRLS